MGWAILEARAAGPRPQGLLRLGLQGFYPETCCPLSGWKGNGEARGLRNIAEKAEQSGPGGSSAKPLRCVATSNSAMPSGLLKTSILIFC